MAMAANQSWKKLGNDIRSDIISLVWGDKTDEEIFLRWTQGFLFTEGEPSALIQVDGGPCAVIAPVQAYILKNLLFPQSSDNTGSTDSSNIDLKTVSAEDAKLALGNSLCDILSNVSQDGNVKLITHSDTSTAAAGSSQENCDGETSNKRQKLFCFDSFHEQLVYKELSFDTFKESADWYLKNVMKDFGVLSLLYSVIYTYGLERISSVVDEPLIDSTFGHGGQCLINLLLTSEATPNVFDGTQDAGGLKLTGISQRSKIGFLTLMEAHSLVAVGWFLKSPEHPIWILGSESHLTVLFSQDREALAEDRQAEVMKIINGFDVEGNGFINALDLAELMAKLELLAEPEEYVNLIKQKLDPEDLGIFLISSFMEVFFKKKENGDEERKMFRLCHYNGIKRAYESHKVEYHYAKATLRDILEPTVVIDSSPILKCLQTKWPTIELIWETEVAPSMN